MSALRARDGVLVVLGNHDREEADRLTHALRERGVTVLRNQWHRIDRGGDELWVLGLDDWRATPGEIEELLGSRPGRSAVPAAGTSLRSESAYGRSAWACSGTRMGGRSGFPGSTGGRTWLTLTGQRAQGLFRLGRGWGHLSAGLGTSGPPMRFGVTPEIAVLVLSEGTASIR